MTAARAPMKLTVYTQPNCPLCDEAIAVVTEQARRFLITVHVIDITQNDKLHAAYMWEVPVITADGDRFPAGVPTARDLAAWLRARAVPRRAWLPGRRIFFRSH